MTRLRSLIVALTLIIALACAANPRAKLVQTHQGIQTILASMDDMERTFCFGSTVPTATPNRCDTEIAKTIGLTNARHQAISAAFIKAYDAQLQIGAAIAIWQPGQTIDLAVALKAASDVNRILAEMNVKVPDLAGLLLKGQQWSAELQRLKALFGGGGSMEVAYGR